MLKKCGNYSCHLVRWNDLYSVNTESIDDCHFQWAKYILLVFPRMLKSNILGTSTFEYKPSLSLRLHASDFGQAHQFVALAFFLDDPLIEFTESLSDNDILYYVYIVNFVLSMIHYEALCGGPLRVFQSF